MKGSVVSLDAIARAARAKGGLIASGIGSGWLFLCQVWRSVIAKLIAIGSRALPRRLRAVFPKPGEPLHIRLFLHRAFQTVLLMMAGFVALSFAWVGIYAVVNPPTTLLMLREQARLGGIRQQWTDFDQIPGHLRRTMVAAEDARFCA
nr:hypothetical protein [Paracoccaceae bacterium]